MMLPEAKPLLVALDLEMNQPSGRIIQIGACVGQWLTGEIVSSFSQLARPAMEPLDPHIVDLTGITSERMAREGVSLEEAYARLQAWLAPYREQRHLNPLTWGGGDSLTLREQLGFGDERWAFGRRWLDVKTVYQTWRMLQNKPIEGGLAKAMTKLGLAFIGRKHDAKDDAVNTFRMYHALLKALGGERFPPCS